PIRLPHLRSTLFPYTTLFRSSFWKEIVAEGRNVRSEEVRHPLRTYRSRFRRGWTEKEAQIVAMEDDRMIGHVYVAREEHPVTRRSEEHTSELQSRGHLVCRLL